MTAKNYFSLEEAESMIPTLTKQMMRLQHLRNQIAVVHTSREALPDVIEAVDEDGMYYYVTKEIRLNKKYHKLSHEFFHRVEQVMQTGVILKDLDDGIVDFLHDLQGRDVFLCWKLGERHIAHFHEIDGDFNDRQKIVDLDKELARYKQRKSANSTRFKSNRNLGSR